MKMQNILLRFILLTILLFAPLSAIEANELWSYDPNKGIEDLQYWTVSTITMSEDNKYVAVGVYRVLSFGCSQNNYQNECRKEESKILLFDISGKLLWEHKTTSEIESIYFSSDSKYILLNNSPTYAYYQLLGYNDRLYLFNLEGELLWIYDWAENGRISSDSVILFDHDFPNYKNYKTILVNIEKEIIKEYPDIYVHTANRDISNILVTDYPYIEVLDKKGDVIWKKSILNEEYTTEMALISDDGGRVVILETPEYSADLSSKDTNIYFLDGKGDLLSTYKTKEHFFESAYSKDLKYFLLAYQTDIKARGYKEGNFSTEKYYNKFVLLDDSGSIVWESTILESPYSLQPYSINICNDKPYILFGLAIREGIGSLFIMDRKTGEIINMLDFHVNKIQVSPDDSYTVIAREEGNNYSKIFLYKTEELVKIENNKTESKDENKSNYPNQLVYVVAIALIMLGAYYYARKH